MAEKRAKKADFTEREIIMLISCVGEHYAAISNSSKTGDVCRKKKQAWDAVTDSVNAVGGYAREVKSLVKKWKDLRDAVKNKQVRAKMTGGGPPDQPAPYEDAILAVLGDTSIIDGFVNEEEGGDTFPTEDAMGTVVKEGIIGSCRGLDDEIAGGDDNGHLDETKTQPTASVSKSTSKEEVGKKTGSKKRRTTSKSDKVAADEEEDFMQLYFKNKAYEAHLKAQLLLLKIEQKKLKLRNQGMTDEQIDAILSTTKTKPAL